MSLKKYILDLTLTESIELGLNCTLLKLTTSDGSTLPEMHPGQFVQVEIKNSNSTYLRRPISINNVDRYRNELWLLVRHAGEGTKVLCQTDLQKSINIILPLGHGFDYEDLRPSSRVLLAGGGVGVAPLYYLGATLKDRGIAPHFLLAARTKSDLLMISEFEKLGLVDISTDDGSCGEKGLIVEHSVLKQQYDTIFCCGPMPMMKAVASIAKGRNISCQVSLENKMACGLGACLCCVEKNKDNHNVCVCTEGPVFNIDQLPW